MFRQEKKFKEYLIEMTLSYVNQANSNPFLRLLNEDLGFFNLYKTDGIKRAKTFLAEQENSTSDVVEKLLRQDDGPLSSSEDYKRYVIYALMAYEYQCGVDELVRAIKLCAQSRQIIYPKADHNCITSDIEILKAALIDGWLKGYRSDRDGLKVYVKFEKSMNAAADKLNCSYNDLTDALDHCALQLEGNAPDNFKQALLTGCINEDAVALSQVHIGLEANRNPAHIEMGFLGKISKLVS